MKYRVIVVDDEPAALDYICMIIKRKCPDYEIAATAGGGKEGLQRVKELRPDVLITDVSMPAMDGIELIKRVRECCPEVCCLIVSGYSDFNYAQEALRLNVHEYILKPVVPSDMKEILDKTASRVAKQHFLKVQNIVKGLLSGREYPLWELKQCFHYDYYYCALIRRNGLPRRFSQSAVSEDYSDFTEYMFILGRDEMEALYIIPEEVIRGASFEKYLENILKKFKGKKEYITLVYNRHRFGLTKLQKQIDILFQALDGVSVVGLCQKLELEQCRKIMEAQQDFNLANLSNLEYLLRQWQPDKAKKLLRQMFEIWERENRTQLWIENVARRIFYMIRQYTKNSIPVLESEYMIEDLFFYSVSMGELAEGLLNIWFRGEEGREESARIDSPEFFSSVEKYIHSHLAESLSMQTLCAEFSVSQTYMGKMFRKYTNENFIHYLTRVRMEQATRIMRKTSDIFIKDVARQVGYQDQFYFSRIFRTYMGMSPSDYLESLQ